MENNVIRSQIKRKAEVGKWSEIVYAAGIGVSARAFLVPQSQPGKRGTETAGETHARTGNPCFLHASARGSVF